MRFVQVNENGSGRANGLAEPSKHVDDEKKDVRSGVAGEGQGLSKEDERRLAEDSNGAVHPPAENLRAQPQPQGQVVCWERFLPVRSLKVLLVESDDSTRHVVSALLRNCSYEVISVSSGIEAWKILEDLDNRIDLVLTEVVMSGLSGIGLLSKIMNHKSCRNVPVIMMSSYDSMGIVLKCLSKGAADFLVKPIRKNELKNLWQHVWRRCHSSSGSGSESGIHDEKTIGAKGAQDSDNDTGSNDDEDDNRSSDLQAQGGSDNGSGTQSSWTKRAAEVDSQQPPSLWDQLADPPDSTCAQVISPGSEAFASSWVPVSVQEQRGGDGQIENISKGNDLEIGIPRTKDSQLNVPSKKVLTTNANRNHASKIDLNMQNDGQNFDEKLDITNDKPKGEMVSHAMNLPGDTSCMYEHKNGSGQSELPTVVSKNAGNKDEAMGHVKELPSLELSLKRLGDVAEASTNVSEQNILRHSKLSAFTRYNTGSTAHQGLTGNVGSCSPVENSSEAMKQPNSDSIPNQNSNSCSNNNDMGSTTNRSFTKPAGATEKVPAKSTFKCSNRTSAFQPVKNGATSNRQLVESGKASATNVMLQENDMSQQVEIQQHHHSHHQIVHSAQKPQHVAARDDLSVRNNNGSAPQCGSSNTRRAITEANTVNRSLNGSACGSNHGSNLNNGSTAAVNVEEMNVDNDNGLAANDGTDNGGGSGSGSGSGNGIGVDQNRSAQREAALNKFRQKRKERCFEKKVRYQSRKKLAEQRPRIRGQFVRKVLENNIKDADEDADS